MRFSFLLVPKLQLGNGVFEAPASRRAAKQELDKIRGPKPELGNQPEEGFTQRRNVKERGSYRQIGGTNPWERFLTATDALKSRLKTAPTATRLSGSTIWTLDNLAHSV